MRRAPQEAELFKTEQAQEGEYAGTDALVREVIQNSLDARHGEGPVTVRIAIHESTEAPDRTRLAHYFARLREPLAGKQITFSRDGVPEIPCKFLVCEDYGTRGLEGNIELFRDPSPDSNGREDFYWFFRNTGRSGKTGDDLGRWGLGKTVYRAASRVGCMLGLTVRQSDKRRLLMGQAVLQIHRHNGQEYQPEGYWCGSQNSDDVPLPISDSAELDRFSQDWSLFRTTEPGLSVVVPFVQGELLPHLIAQAVAVHFFIRILRGELVVEVVGPAFEAVLDRERLGRECDRFEWDGPRRTKRHMPPPLDFAQRCLNLAELVPSQVMGTTKLPDTTEAFADVVLNELRQRFAGGELLAIRARIWLLRLKGSGIEGSVDVFLQRQSTAVRHDSYYVREGMTITKINSSAARHGVQALVVVDRGPLAELLGDTEGPAHEDWQTSADRPGQTWKTWKGRVTFVRKIVDHLADLLTPPATKPDFDLLADFFSIQRTQGQQRKPKPGEDDETETSMEPVVPHPKWFQITERSGGFTVSRNQGIPLPVQPALKVAIAYDIPNGDPLRNWSPIDFEIFGKNGGLTPKGHGVKPRRIDGNILHLDVQEEDFRFVVQGFDPHRDLYVRVDEISGEESAEESES